MSDIRFQIGVICAFALAVNGCGDAGARGSLPYRTVMDSSGDTIVARTKGDVPATFLKKLVLEWRAGGNAQDTSGAAEVSGMTLGADGRVFVWDRITPALWLYSADGKTVKRIGGKGAGPGEYDRSNGIAARPDGKLVMWDGGNARLNVWDANGAFVTSWKLAFGGTFTSNGVVADVGNRTWIRTSVHGNNESFDKWKPAWFRWDSSGTTVDTVYQPTYEGSDAPLVARHQDAGGTSSSSSSLPFGKTPSFAVSPLGVVVSGPGGPANPYVVNAELHGKPVRIERDWIPIPVTPAERAQRRAQMEWNMRRTQENWTWTGPDIPTDKPAYAGLLVGADGRIWVQLNVPSQPYEPDPPSAQDKNPAPQIKFRPSERRWDVFEPDGHYLGRVVGDRRFTPYAMRGDYVWGVLLDEDDVPGVVKMRIDSKF